MLVATLLISLLMLMFAEVFTLASGSLAKQRGVAENDQRARMVTTLLRSDVERRTFRSVLPFLPGEPVPMPADADFALRDYAARRGYFYVSENDPDSDADDVLQMTIEIGANDAPLYGVSAFNFGAGERNQPVWDDGDFNNGATSATQAEVVWFLRNGNLYRRMLVLRQPLVTTAPLQPQPAGGPPDFFNPASATPYPAGRVFWRDFDYSAHHNAGVGYAWFHGADWLTNDGAPALPAAADDLGWPRFRFGHNHADGQPREFLNAVSPGSAWIGRFVHEETSHAAFVYPQSAAGNPMDRATLLTLGTDAIVTAFSAGPRRGEDLVLSNVLAFDVKVWDEALAAFVDVGHGIPGGDYRQTAATNRHLATVLTYGPTDAPATNRVFDTWHPTYDHNGDNAADHPPFRAARPGPDGQPGVAGADDDGNGTTDDPTELGWPGSDDVVVPLSAVQIVVRYLDTTSGQIRQTTNVISLAP
jgi:hypothetical protein